MDQCEGSYALGPKPELSVLLVSVVGYLEVRACDEDDSFEGMVEFRWDCRGGISGGSIVCDVVD